MGRDAEHILRPDACLAVIILKQGQQSSEAPDTSQPLKSIPILATTRALIPHFCCPHPSSSCSLPPGRLGQRGADWRHPRGRDSGLPG